MSVVFTKIMCNCDVTLNFFTVYYELFLKLYYFSCKYYVFNLSVIFLLLKNILKEMRINFDKYVWVKVGYIVFNELG